MTETLLRELLGEAEEMAERHREDRLSYQGHGDMDAEIDCLRHERHTRSVIRRARKVLADMLGVCHRCGLGEGDHDEMCWNAPPCIVCGAAPGHDDGCMARNAP